MATQTVSTQSSLCFGFNREPRDIPGGPSGESANVRIREQLATRIPPANPALCASLGYGKRHELYSAYIAPRFNRADTVSACTINRHTARVSLRNDGREENMFRRFETKELPQYILLDDALRLAGPRRGGSSLKLVDTATIASTKCVNEGNSNNAEHTNPSTSLTAQFANLPPVNRSPPLRINNIALPRSNFGYPRPVLVSQRVADRFWDGMLSPEKIAQLEEEVGMVRVQDASQSNGNNNNNNNCENSNTCKGYAPSTDAKIIAGSVGGHDMPWLKVGNKGGKKNLALQRTRLW